MELEQPLRLAFLLFVALLTLFSSQAEAAPPELELAGRTVSMELIDSANFSPQAWPNEIITLTTQIAITKAGDSIFDLLEANGIQPDTEAYTLVYDLNPNLEKVDPLPPNTKLVLPRVAGGTLFQQAVKSGRLVMITVDAKIKSQLGSNVMALTELSARFARLDRNRFADPIKRQETIGFVQDLVGWFEHIHKTFAQRTAKPLRRVTLLQTANEAEILRSILEQALAPGQKLSAADQIQLTSIHQDVEQTMTKWDETMAGELPSGEPQYNVVVEIRGIDTNRIRNLRVYYVADGLFRNPPVNPPVRSTNFNGLGSGTSATLPIKDYKIWGAQDGDPMHPATPPADLKVRKPATGNTINIALSLLESPAATPTAPAPQNRGAGNGDGHGPSINESLGEMVKSPIRMRRNILKRLLATFVQIIVFLFAAFGGFLSNIAPPGQANPKFAVGLSSFLALIVLLIVSALAKNASTENFKKRWIVAGIICFILAIPLGILYPWALSKLTYPYPPPPDEPVAQHINGLELTQTAKDFIKENPGSYSPGQLELKLPYDDIWTADSVGKAKMILLINYISLVLSISTAIFCLLEANLKSYSRRINNSSTRTH